MIPPEENPLAGRVCADRIATYPNTCIGEKCSAFETCIAEILRAQHAIDNFRKHPAHPRVMAGKKWGER